MTFNSSVNDVIGIFCKKMLMNYNILSTRIYLVCARVKTNTPQWKRGKQSRKKIKYVLIH